MNTELIELLKKAWIHGRNNGELKSELNFYDFLNSINSEHHDETKTIIENEHLKEILKYLVQHSSDMPGERLRFYVDYIQPINEYFKID